MVQSTPQTIARQIPIITGGMVLSALIVYASPALASFLMYDRAAILSGELWRLVTGHWVHFSFSHLFYDLLALTIAGWLIERRGYPRFGLLCLLSTLGISTVLLAVKPEISLYGGLSGVAYSAFVYLIFSSRSEPPPWPWIGRGLLLLMMGKFLLEAVMVRPLLVTTETNPFVSVPLSHAIGGFIALFVFWGTAIKKKYVLN